MKGFALVKKLLLILSLAALLLLSSCVYSFFPKGKKPKDELGGNTIKTDITAAFELVSRDNKQVLTGPGIYNKVAPSVVSVLNYSNASATQHNSEGSGVIMLSDIEDHEGYYVITNAHVIQNAAKLVIVLNDEDETSFTVINTSTQKYFWYDVYTDIGVVKLETDDDLPEAEFGDADELEIGEDIYAIGNPGGMEYKASITRGIVSYRYREYHPESDSYISVNCIQVDAPINPGNSGGALVNIYGQVVGINSAKIAHVNFEGMGFSISINDALFVISELLTNGYVRRPAFGITCTYKEYSLFTNPPTTVSGAEIVTISANSAFTDTEVAVGDLIVEVEGIKINSLQDVFKGYKNKKPGDNIEIKYRKKSQGYATLHSLTITLVEAQR